MGSDSSGFQLGGAWIHPQLDEIERDDEVVHVEARSMQVLLCLVRHAPELVTREALLEEVWSDTPYVSDEVLSHAVWELRKALGDSARDPRFIRTVPRKGYQLVAPIDDPAGVPEPTEGARIQHFELLEEIGRGAMGVVYRARDRRLDRVVAVKFLAPELTRDEAASRRFLREARLAASLEHPNLATVLEIGETSTAQGATNPTAEGQLPSGQRFLVTAYYAGGSLAERLAKGPIPFDDAARMVRQAAAGLGAAHARGIVHRDVKPANLLLDEHGTVKVADFGIAKLLGATSLTRTGASLGTPAYKSPEQSRGSEVDQRTDLWSLGVVLYELLTGRKPFDAEYEQAVVHSILAFEPQILETADGRLVPEPLRRIVSRAMAKDPDQRYQRAGELIADLDAWLRGETTQPIPTLRRRSTQIALGAAVVLSLLLAYTGSWRGPLLHLGVMGPVGGQPATPADDFEIQLSNGQHAWLMGNTGEHLDEAEACFEKALALRPESTKAKGLLAVLKVEEFILWHREEDQDQLDALLEELRPLGESAPLGLIAESKLSSLLKRYEEAEALARRAISAWQTCAYPEACDLGYVWLGEALAKQGKYEEAKAELESGLLVGGGRIRCRLKLAQVFEWEGDFNRASTAYEEVRSIDPDQTTMLNDYGNLLLKHRDFTRAAGLFLHLTTKTEDPVAFYNLGNAYYGQGLWEEAFAEYENAEQRYRGRGELTPVTAIAFGDVRAEQEDDEGARNWYRIALERLEERLASEASGLYDQCRHAVVLGKLGRLAEAERDIDALLENPPKQGEAFIWLSAARIAALKQDRRALETSARRYLELEPEPDRLKDDVAFKAYRHDSDYTHFLNSVMEDLQRR